jgi:hypothetical protein
MKFVKPALISLAVMYLIFIGAIFYLMRQPPQRFAAAIAKMPGPAFMLIPFETLWFRARAGAVRPGDAAPDFRLNTLDRKSEVSLASFRGVRPVVLIFGSYT